MIEHKWNNHRTRDGLQHPKIAAVFAALLGAAVLLVATTAQAKRVSAPPTRARIDVVFVLDTTGSMAGLIEGAKQKIWSIANRMSDAKGQPDIHIGLVGYRDRGDEYITRRFDLSSDIDAIYTALRAFQADGGGDTPESVNQALHEALTELHWRDGEDVYKVVFLVGDAPPHMDYPDDVKYPASLALAARQGVVVNTIQCGGLAETTPIWQEIARRGEGEFAVIAQNGGMVAMETPLDREIESLNHTLAATLLPYGEAAQKRGLFDKLEGAARAGASVVASRLSYLSKNGATIVSSKGDLVDDLQAGRVRLEEIPRTALPEGMQNLSAPAAREFLDRKTRRREELQQQIDGLLERRETYLEEARKHRRASGLASGFDEQVIEMVRSQAAEKGIEFE